MEGTTGSEGTHKPWDHAWSTEEMRTNRREWSLAADSGLLKHLQQFSENLTKKATETQDAINSMTSQLNEAAILVDNITNTSLALANTQFIESRVQEDNVEIEQPVEDKLKNTNDQEFSASDLLASVCESIRQGLSIMDEKFEKVEVIASDSEDEDDNPVPSVILRPKNPYQNRPLPYVFDSEQWKASNKVGLESSSSESEQNEEEDSISDSDNKSTENILHSNTHANIGISRPSSSSGESNDYNIESNSIKDTGNARLHARSQDTLNSYTEATTPSNVLSKVPNVSNGPPSFAEELAKRLGNVLPSQKEAAVSDSNQQIIDVSKDDIFTPEDDADVFSNNSNKLFSEGKNLFSDEISSSWKNTSRPVNKNIIPSSIDIPPPLSIISSAPKSTIDDLFGDADDSEDSDDIFSKKSSKNIFTAERECVRSEVVGNKLNPNVESVQNSSAMKTSTPEMNDKGKGLFDDEEDDDLFGSSTKQIKSSVISSTESSKKKPHQGAAGASILSGNKVDVFSSSKLFPRRGSSSSSTSSASGRSDSEMEAGQEEEHERRGAVSGSSSIGSSNKTRSGGGATTGSGSVTNVSSSVEAGNNADVSPLMPTLSSGIDSSSSGVSLRQPSSIDNTAGSSLGADFQPVMTSSRLKSEEIFRERVASDSLFSATTNAAGGNRTDSSAAAAAAVVDRHREEEDRVEEQRRLGRSQEDDDGSEHEDVFGPPPLPKVNSGYGSKSKVTSLFDDSDSGDDLFASPSPGSRSLQNSEHTPSKAPNQKKRNLFDDDDDLFGPRDELDVDLFGVKKTPDSLFDRPGKTGIFSSSIPTIANPNLGEKGRGGTAVSSIFGNEKASTSDLFGKTTIDKNLKATASSEAVFKEPAKPEKVPEKKTTKNLTDLFKDSDDSNLFGPSSAGKATDIFSGSKSIFADTTDADLFGRTPNILEKNISGKSSNLFDDLKESEDLFGNKSAAKGKESDDNLFANTSEVTKSKKVISIFDDCDDDDDLFGGPSLSKKNIGKDLFEDNKNMDTKKEAVAENAEKKDENVKPAAKKGIFNDDVDEDSLFGEKNSKNSRTKQAILPKAILSEINQKLEKHRIKAEAEPKPAVNTVPTKNDPPNSLNIDKSVEQQAKKPAVSNKIKNLMGKMGDLKILSPTDTPPQRRKNSDKEEEQEPADTVSANSNSEGLPSKTPDNSRVADSTSLEVDNKQTVKPDKVSEGDKLTTADSKDKNSNSKNIAEIAKEDKTNNKKTATKSNIFDEDDDEDLFGSKLKKDSASVKENVKNEESTKNVKEVSKSNQENKSESNNKAELTTKLDATSKKAITDEIKEKIAKNQTPVEISPSTVDGAVASKKEPPKTLKLQTPIVEPPQQQLPKKPVVSNKIKNLMGKMGDLKILSPIDSPPLLRANSEEVTEKEEEQESPATDFTSSEASSPSLASGGSSPQISGTSRARDSPSLRSDNTEIAISLDEPAQVEPLLSTSKSRVRIPGKRRPQSRHARQSALRQSGIDFDVTDATNTNTSDDVLNDNSSDFRLKSDRLLSSRTTHSYVHQSATEYISQQVDDKSELSASRNTTTNLLSPSTDEEDLFDVPPDLPEDPAAREDSLFGRAPILSPVETIDRSVEVSETLKNSKVFTRTSQVQKATVTRDEVKSEKTEKLDPLRDSSHDPLKDPSQLFAFVTKTPSPEKNKGLLLSEDDDSLFSNTSKSVDTKFKPALNLFNEDDDGGSSDLFSSSKIKKPLKDAKIDPFDDPTLDDDDDASLFGFATKKSGKEELSKQERSTNSSTAAVSGPNKIDSTNAKATNKNIFGNSSDEEDLFASHKKVIPKKITKSIFGDEDDNVDEDDIFGKPKRLSSTSAKDKSIGDNTKPIVKKAITRDLKKTAEKIVKDPLSMLQDD